MRIIKIDKIDTIFDATQTFDKIINYAHEKLLIVDFSTSNFIRNHFISIIGMGLKVAQKRGILIEIRKPKSQKVLNSMKRINFLSKFSDESNENDTYKTMVRYTNIPLKDNSLLLQEFYAHFIEQFMGKVANLSPKLQKRILQKLFELFSNVFRHSNSELGLFCSGQFYPRQDKFNFTIVDNGVTIKKNVNRYLLQEFLKGKSISTRFLGKKFTSLNGVESIQWALKDEHSTTGEGGLGLSLLMELIHISKGSIEIISADGYYGIKMLMKLEKHYINLLVVQL